MLNPHAIARALNQRALCPACGNTFVINDDKKIRKHSLLGNGAFECPGSYMEATRIVVDVAVLEELLRRVTGA